MSIYSLGFVTASSLSPPFSFTKSAEICNSAAVSRSSKHNDTSKRDLSCHAKISLTTSLHPFPRFSSCLLPHQAFSLGSFPPDGPPLQSHAGFTGGGGRPIARNQVDLRCKHVVLYFVSTLVAVSFALPTGSHHTLGAVWC